MGDVLAELHKAALARDCPNGCVPAGRPCRLQQVCVRRIPDAPKPDQPFMGDPKGFWP